VAENLYHLRRGVLCYTSEETPNPNHTTSSTFP
jgi:hypothetical protein